MTELAHNFFAVLAFVCGSGSVWMTARAIRFKLPMRYIMMNFTAAALNWALFFHWAMMIMSPSAL